MKKIFIALLSSLFFASQCLAVSPLQRGYEEVIARKNAAGGAPTCTVDNDSLLINEAGTASGTSSSVFIAGKFTISATTDITAYMMEMHDNSGANTGSVNFSIYTDNSNKPGTEVSGTEINVLASALGDTAGSQIVVNLSSAYQNLSAGTYWLVNEEVSSADVLRRRKTDTGDTRCYSDDGTTWTCTADQSFIFGIYGCQ